MTETFIGRHDPTPARCERCGSIPSTEPRPVCAGCGKWRPPCHCTQGWSQQGNALRFGEVWHYCPRCSP